jgi:hypothetical protein
MDLPYRAFPFRWVLPIAQLLVCIAMVWPSWPGMAVQTWHSMRRSWAGPAMPRPLPEPNIEVHVVKIPPGLRQPDVSEMRMVAPAALNLPVLLIQLPYMTASRAGMEWTPGGMWFEEWRALAWPFAGMLFWWLAGRGLEALVAARRGMVSPPISWIELAIGVSLLVLGAASCLTLGFGRRAFPEATDFLFAIGGGLWAALAAATIAARILQWRIRRIEKRQSIAQPA